MPYPQAGIFGRLAKNNTCAVSFGARPGFEEGRKAWKSSIRPNANASVIKTLAPSLYYRCAA